MKTIKNKKLSHNSTLKKKDMFPTTGHPGNKAYSMTKNYLRGQKIPDKNYITYVNTSADYYQNKLNSETRNINFIDHQPYFKTYEMAQQMVHMMANLFNDKNYTKAHGATTIGSSEAIYVSTVLHKYAWEDRNNKNASNICDMIWSENTHINWDKAARWNDIKTTNKIKLKHMKWVFGAEEVEKNINPNTIAVICTLANTRTAQNDNIEEINTFLKKYHKKTGIFVPIHIDAAIGGFLAPFYSPKKLKWDFELEHVKSINVSFHKYGGTYAGMGMLVVKSDYKIPEKMKFFFDAEQLNLKPTLTKKERMKIKDQSVATDAKIVSKEIADGHASGLLALKKPDPSDHVDLQINFSKSSSQITSAFYNFMKLGKSGYKKRILKCIERSKIISDYLNSLKSKEGKQILIQVNEPYYPVLAYYLNDNTFPLSEILTLISQKYGYSLAGYIMGSSGDTVFRLVFKHNVSQKEAIEFLNIWKKVINKVYYDSDVY